MKENSIKLLSKQIKCLLSSEISRQNKIWLAVGWGIEYRWKSGNQPLKNGLMDGRLEFLIDNEWLVAKSWDEDVKPFLKESNGMQTM